MGYFRNAGELTGNDVTTKAHCLYDRKTKPLELAGKKKSGTMSIEPVFFRVFDLACQKHSVSISRRNLLANIVCIRAGSFAADVEMMVWKGIHQRQKCLEILLGNNLSDGEKELCRWIFDKSGLFAGG